MDPISLAFTFLMQNPDKAVAGVQQLTRPGNVNVSKMKESFADLSRGILNCYHRTARFQLSDIIQKPWIREAQYGADNSALIRIQYTGLTASNYQMVVAVLGRGTQIRTAVITDSAVVPYSKRCELEQWTDASNR
ncbi:MAG: hypothetical protein ACM3SS_11720 [Rhodospirillaceae bacterium]